jgi:hypothetical protein
MSKSPETKVHRFAYDGYIFDVCADLTAHGMFKLSIYICIATPRNAFGKDPLMDAGLMILF